MANNPFINFLSNKGMRKAIWVFIVLLIIFLLAKYVMAAFLVMITVGIALIMNLSGFKILGLEFATLSTIVFGYAFGPKFGAIMGLILILLQIIIGGYINVYVMWVVPGYIVLGFLAGLLNGYAIGTLGPVLTGIMLFTFSLFTFLLTPGALPHYLPYAGSNFIINLILFNFFAPWIIEVMV